MVSETRNKVLVIGAGMAGPILALFLTDQGFDPVLFEAHSSLEDAGLSILLQPNGLKVLDLIPGLLARLPGVALKGVRVSSLVQDKTLVFHDAFEQGNFHVRGVPRTQAHKLFVEMAQEHGIPIHWGHKLVSFEQTDVDVKAIFANGQTHTGTFVVGCDGLHSGSRTALFGRERAEYLGMTQTGGWSPVPQAFLGDGPRMYQFYAEGAHVVGYYCAEDTVSWVITQREEEKRESWRGLDDSQIEAIRKSTPAHWPMGAGDLIRTAGKYVKYGLHDRPALASWHKDRVVLLGDAAHPTSPHLGQGANQAFEDIYHLLRALKVHGVTPNTPISTDKLEAAFLEYEKVRIPRSTTLVEGARREGDKVRVVYGFEACKTRDAMVAEAQGEEATLLRMQSYISQPFDGVSEI